MSPTPTDPNQAQAWITGDPPDQTIDFYIPRGNTGPMGPQGPIGPSLIVGNVETNMGPAASGTMGPQGPTGVKGDPGGWTLGTLLAATTDLNSVITSGLYRIEGAPNTGLNWPIIASGVLHVEQRSTTNFLLQEYTPLWATNSVNATTFYRRWMLNGVWSNWRVFSSTRVDQTAGRVMYQWDDVNNREQLVFGDTGWRELSATSLINGWTANSVLVRRFNNLVSFKLYQLNPTSATSDVFLASLPGFTRTHGAGYILFPKSGVEVAFLNMASTGFQFNPRGSAVYGTGGYTEVQWTTTDAWPTSLPGTASGGVPNA